MDKYRKLDDYVELFVDTLKNRKNLPFKIPRKGCPQHKKICRRKHGEIVVKSYNRHDDTFRLLYYGVHITGIIFDVEQKPSVVKKFIIASIRTRKLKFNRYRKRLNMSKVFRKNRLWMGVTDAELKILERKAKEKGMKVTDYLLFRGLN